MIQESVESGLERVRACSVVVPVKDSCQTSSSHQLKRKIDENETEIKDWGNLPSIPLTKILMCLSDSNRAKVSMVCKHWYAVFHTAVLWRERHFRFGGYRCNLKEVEKMIGYGKRFGRHLHDLWFACDHPTLKTCRQMQKGVSTFFGVLLWRDTKVKNFYFNNMQSERYWRHLHLKQRLFTSMCRFLRRQHHLESFQMSNASITLPSGLKLLEALAHGSGSRLSDLCIDDFFIARSSVQMMTKFKISMAKFSNLTSLQTNYNYLNEEILTTLCENCRSKFHYLEIKVYRWDPHYHRIDQACWARCKRSSPHLTVSLDFEGIGHRDELTGIMNMAIPLVSVSLWTGLRDYTDNWRIPDTLWHMARHFSKTLEDVSLCMEIGNDEIDEALLGFLEAGHKLEVLDLQAPVKVATLKRICKLQEEYKIGLLRCHITTERLSPEEEEEMEQLEKDYEVLFYERGVDFSFVSTDMTY